MRFRRGWRILLIDSVDDFNNREMIRHEKVYPTGVSAEPDITGEPLHELIRHGARQLMAAVVEAELEAMLNAVLTMGVMPSSVTVICHSVQQRVAAMAVSVRHIHR
ncbi:hypothetical protein SGGMMB4_03154 [Sodalis glossinidius str. 'morsitans']|uniref:Uncharacterized protein n=1 Tax=Sodalis glossinidius (strain morsitans) TaxID=343509 RepID=A0A193QKI8_SODGM|nr:hypothetical protein SGGMMB4_03154 [Sodalis glossinidius str. 'morsitans']